MKPYTRKNVNAVKKIIKLYRTANIPSIREFLKEYDYGDGADYRVFTLYKDRSCPACSTADGCSLCLTYVEGLTYCYNQETYKALDCAKTPEAIKKACFARAKYLETLIKGANWGNL